MYRAYDVSSSGCAPGALPYSVVRACEEEGMEEQLRLDFEDACKTVDRPPERDRPLRTFERHHRRARSLGGSNDTDNIALVDGNLHQAYHLLFGPGDPSLVVALLNHQYGPPDVMFYWVPRSPRGLRQICQELNRLSKNSRYEIVMRRKNPRNGKLPKDRRRGPHRKPQGRE